MPGSTSTPIVPFVPTLLLALNASEIDALWKFITSAMKHAGFDAGERVALLDVLAQVENGLLIARSDGAAV